METTDEAPSVVDTNAHIENPGGNQRCKCGCVPNILSLFEMAEFRAKKRAADALKASKKTEA